MFVRFYLTNMIASFKNRALKKYWTKNDASGIRPDWVAKVRIALSRLDASAQPEQMDIPGFGFHRLTGDLAGRYSVTISRNWRMTFGWNGEDAIDVDLEDYHVR
jgi:toxin HigB-1